MTRKLLATLTLTLALTLTLPALAQEATPSDDDVNRVASGLYCPVCENIPLDVCPTQACAQWRATIREKLAEGWSDEQIKDYFVQQYGDRVLAEPPRRGLNWLVYILPPLGLLAGAFIVFRAIRNWRELPDEESGRKEEGMAPPDDEYVARLEAELERRK